MRDGIRSLLEEVEVTRLKMIEAKLEHEERLDGLKKDLCRNQMSEYLSIDMRKLRRDNGFPPIGR